MAGYFLTQVSLHECIRSKRYGEVLLAPRLYRSYSTVRLYSSCGTLPMQSETEVLRLYIRVEARVSHSEIWLP